jgi:ribosomal protein S18 acetylase RimI-like enzyme
MKVSLRPATPVDREFLFRVYATTREKELALVPWTEEQKSMFLNMQFDAQDRDYRGRYPNAEFSIIVIDGEGAGRLYVSREDGRTQILDITILPLHRGRGAGAALVRQLQGEGQPLAVWVDSSSDSSAIFEHLGFRTEREDSLNRLMRWTKRD